MQFFNIRYECNDVRDAFSTQLKKGDMTDTLPQWMSSEVVDDMDDIDQLHHGDDFGDSNNNSDDEDFGKNKYSKPRVYEAHRIAEMEAAKMGSWLA